MDENGLKSELYEKTLQNLIECDNFVVFKKHREEEAVEAVAEDIGLSLGKNVKGVFLLKRKDGNREIDFLVNATGEEKAFTVKRKGFSGAEIWNAENGEITPADYTKQDGETTVYVRLRPYGSVIVAFSNDCGKPRAEVYEKIIADVTENWIVKESGKEVERANFFAAGKQNFSGEVTFMKKISIEKPGGKVMLGLENVQSYASVKVNGGFAGAKLLPVAEFAKQFVITEIMPELCNVYYKPMELSRATEVGVVYSRDCLYPGCGNNSMMRYLRRLSTYRRIYAFKCDNLHGWHETKTIKF